MARILVHLKLPASQAQQSAARLKTQAGVSLGLVLRSIVSGGICAAAGPTLDVMRRIGGLAVEGAAVLLTAETK